MAHHFKAYHLNAGCCTRCSTPISSAYVVPENVYWRFIGDCGLYQKQAAPVCETCVTPFEANGCRAPSPCEGCGMTLRMHWRYSSRFCSERCQKRGARKRAQAERAEIECAVCHMMFQPKRSDTKFCGASCKQWAYRRRGAV